MVEKYNLKEVWIPEDDRDESPKCNIFMSQEFKEPVPRDNLGKKALVIIQGSGHVRPGIWSRRVCLDQDLESGSMLP